MSIINCPECGKEISDKATNCPNCGCPSIEWAKTERENEHDNDNKVLRKNEEPDVKGLAEQKKDAEKNNKKKDSTLSILACVLTLFTVTIPVAFILALVDLSINDKKRKHGGSWFAIIFSVLVVVIAFLLKFL